MVLDALQSLGIVAVGTGAAGLVARYGIDRFSQVVERGIEQCFDEEFARYRAELENDQEVFSRLHEERATVVVELYERFVRFERDVRAIRASQSSEPPSDELLQAAARSGDEFAEFYALHKIYFPTDTCDAVESVLDATSAGFAESPAVAAHGGLPEHRPAVESWVADWRDATEDEVPELKRELEAHCRDLLGVELDDERPASLDS